MHFYRERLFAPPLWWVVGMITMLTFGAIVWTGFDLVITIAVFAVLIGVTAAFLLNWGRATIEVTAGELQAGGLSLPLALAGEVAPLDETADGRPPRTASRPARVPADQAIPPALGLHRGHGQRSGRAVLARCDPAPRQARSRDREFTPRGQFRRRGHDMIG